MSVSTSSACAALHAAALQELRASSELVAAQRVVGVRERVAHRRVEDPVQRLFERGVAVFLNSA